MGWVWQAKCSSGGSAILGLFSAELKISNVTIHSKQIHTSISGLSPIIGLRIWHFHGTFKETVGPCVHQFSVVQVSFLSFLHQPSYLSSCQRSQFSFWLPRACHISHSVTSYHGEWKMSVTIKFILHITFVRTFTFSSACRSSLHCLSAYFSLLTNGWLDLT